MDTLTRGVAPTGGSELAYSEVSQSDDDTRNGSSPTTSPSPTESPMPFLSIAEKAFTPLSMDSSDLEFAGIGEEMEKKDLNLIRTGADNQQLDVWAREAHDRHQQAGNGNGDNVPRRSPQQQRGSSDASAFPAASTTETQQPLSAVNVGTSKSGTSNSTNNSTNNSPTADAPSEPADTTIRARKHRSSRDVTQLFHQEAQQNVSMSPAIIKAPVKDKVISQQHQKQILGATPDDAIRCLKSAVSPSAKPSRLLVGADAPRLTRLTTSINNKSSLSAAIPNHNNSNTTTTTSPGSPSPSAPVSPISPRSRIYRQQQKQQHLHRFPDLDPSDIEDDLHNVDNQLLLESDLFPDPLQPQPIVRTASNSTVSLCHPTPDLNTQSGAYIGNVAALEATAERLSITSSIDDAIRQLHQDLKRSESRRSSIIQASLNQLNASPSAAGSIVSINNAARQGGYSPGGYILSPNHSLTGSRLRSGSRDSRSSRNDEDHLGSSYSSGFLSRTGPGKGSQRSIRSSKPSLSEIAEMELPVSLTKDAMDEADRAAAIFGEGLDDTTTRDEANGPKTPTMNLPSYVAGQRGVPPPPPPHREKYQQQQGDAQNEMQTAKSNDCDDRPTTAASVTTFDQAQLAFGDFDGVHCPTESQPNSPPLNPVSDLPPSRRRRVSQIPPLPRAASGRPTSYFDPESGSQMLYYPARVPAMLNLPPKLSKSGGKAAARNQRRSQIPTQMPETNRASTMWLPDPLEGHAPTPFFPDKAESHPHLRSTSEVDTIKDIQGALNIPLVDSSSNPSKAPLESPTKPSEPGPNLASPGEPQPSMPEAVSRPRPREIDSDLRKSRMSTNLAALPPQLRASAYFDLPSELPTIEVKDGSATATLDSILDASADAPVSAFTDHVFAGKLGAEVYGREKKRKSVAHTKTLSTSSLNNNKSRLSFFGLKKHGDKQESEEDPNRRNTITSPGQNPDDPEGQHLPDHVDEKASDEAEEEEEEEEQEYDGPPTTLLAELQIRKQQQKQRTRKLNGINGLHATLLELDAVAELERKSRKGKKVNLAWEEPESDHDSDDEEVPLGVLYAAKAMSTKDLGAAVAEMNRPLGLMEKREMEDNEPLSRRRDRLQGRNPNVRASQLTLTPQIYQEPMPDEDEDDDEPLAARQRRLKGDGEDDLPRARPVSEAFSAELLGQFGDKEEKTDDEPNRRQDNATPAEETLGQRRLRLQAERESAGLLGPKKMSSMADVLGAYGASRLSVAPNPNRRASGFMNGAFNDGTGGGLALPTTDPRAEERARLEQDAKLVQEQNEKMRAMRASMPQVLNEPSHNNRATGFLGGALNDGTGGTGISRRVLSDPRAEERAKIEEQERLVWEQEQRMRNMKAQMPTELPSLSKRASGYMGGMFNDGTGGLLLSAQQQQQQQTQNMLFQGGMMGPARGMGVGGYVPAAGNMGMSVGMGMQMPIGGAPTMNPMGMGMQGMNMGIGAGIPPPAPGQQMDRVEMWRHSVTQ